MIGRKLLGWEVSGVRAGRWTKILISEHLYTNNYLVDSEYALLPVDMHISACQHWNKTTSNIDSSSIQWRKDATVDLESLG